MLVQGQPVPCKCGWGQLCRVGLAQRSRRRPGIVHPSSLQNCNVSLSNISVTTPVLCRLIVHTGLHCYLLFTVPRHITAAKIGTVPQIFPHRAKKMKILKTVTDGRCSIIVCTKTAKPIC